MRHTLDGGAGLFDRQRRVERHFKVLALARVGDAAIADGFDRMVNRFALRVEHARFQGDVDFSLHNQWSVASGQWPVISRERFYSFTDHWPLATDHCFPNTLSKILSTLRS